MLTHYRLLHNAEPTEPAGGAAPAATAEPPSTPAPAAPAPAAVPPPEESKATEDAYERIRSNLLFANVEKDLEDDKEDEEEGDTPKPPKAEEKKDDLPPPPPAEPAKPKVTVKKKEPPVPQVIKETIIREVPAPAPAAPKVDETVVTEDDEKYIAQLNEEQRYELEVAKAAEGLDAKYKGRAKALVKFNRDLDAFAQGGDKSEEEIQEFVKKNKPEFGRAEFRKLEREIAATEAERRAEAKFATEKEEMKLQIRKLEKDPEIKATQQKVVKEFVKDLGDDPAAKLYQEKGIDEARKEYPLEAEIYEGAAQEAVLITTEYQNLAYGLTKFSSDNPTHIAISEFVEGQCQWFKQNGGDDRKRDGKDFLTRGEYNEEFRKDPAAAKKKYWTLGHDEIIACLRQNVALGAKEQVKNERAKAEKRGFVPKVKPGVPKSENPPTPINPPKANPSPAPGSAKQPEKKAAPSGLLPLSLDHKEK